MSEVQQLRDMLKLQLTPADQGTIANQAEETYHLKEENKRDMQQLLVSKEEFFPEHQEWNLNDDQENIKEEEKLWIGQQGVQLQQLEEADLTMFGFTAVTVKIENDDHEKPETSQLPQSQSDESTDTEPVASSSSVHRTLITKMEGEDNEGPQPASFSGLNSHLQLDTYGRSSDSSETDTDDSYDWKQTRELWSGFNCQKNNHVVSSSNCNIVEKQFNCSEYGKASGHMNNLEQHKGRQAREKSFSCTNGGKRLKQKGTLKTHMRKKLYQCSDCGQKFGRKCNLNRHMIIHTGQKPFGCSECGQRFGLKCSLNRHMIIHTGQKPFGCSECGKRFGRNGNLNRHMIVHTGEKPFSCPECGQRFGLKNSLNTHMIIHTGEKPFVCSKCGKRFGLKSHLNTHMIIHAGHKPFGCSEFSLFSLSC
ncbi:gastrula zinc finger protein XlCGF57.1-like [Thalassophryne amazonica]|uniref:gastrula zinc finger protein XlCGF57.1-like n=1 Tax=Thalassophryne amazonica TaxID=390379 RepID=UPI0014724742|nr:gastrula zinc finger protein XlCGF57.1-like [Thalassophryne amazonica]